MTRFLLREPLLHFLLLGGVLYALLGDSAAESDSATVEVSPSSLYPFIAARDPRIDASSVTDYLAELTHEQRSRLIDDYVREEILVREAKALGLDQEDAYSRKRLVSRLQYINEAFVADMTQITNNDIANWYAENPDRYMRPPYASFRHVFFATESDDENAAEERAIAQKKELARGSIPPHQAAFLGDRFHYHQNYGLSSYDEIASHFGSAFADTLFVAKTDQNSWQGPWRSKHGWHLVRLAERNAESTPPLSEVADQVRSDIIAERRHAANQIFYSSARRNYKIIVDISGEELDAG